MKIISKIFSFLGCINFNNPKKEKIVIFDKEGSDVIIKTVLHDLPYVILPARGEQYFFSIQIIFRWLIKFRPLDLINKRINLENNYYLSCIEYIKPVIVITVVENNYSFQGASKNFPDAVFVAIQNGRRSNQPLWDHLTVVGDEKLRHHLPHFFCFGQNDVDQYQKFGHTIYQAYPVGSLKAGYYRSYVDPDKLQCSFDICLISQYRESILEWGQFPEIKKGLLILFEYLRQFAQENEVRFCVALSYRSEKEQTFYQTIFGEDVELIKQKPDSFFSSYEAIDASNVSLVLDSTLGVEAFGFGKKILFCNFTGSTDYDINCTDFCKINIADYDCFSQKLKNLLLMDQNMFLKMTERHRNYLMNYNPDCPAHKVVRKLIENYL